MTAWAQPADTELSRVLDVVNGMLLTAVVIAFACLIVRWLLPLALRVLLEPLQDMVDIAAACLLLPEYWLSCAGRRVGGRPPQLAYEYGNAVGWITRLLHAFIRRCFSGLDSAAGAVPLLLVGMAAGGIMIGHLLR